MNHILEYSNILLKSQQAIINTNISDDYNLFLNNGAGYYKCLYATENDYTLFNKLKEELIEYKCERLIWSKHYKYDDPYKTPTFCELINNIQKDFKIEIIESRLNYYNDRNDWKPMHQDSHAYNGNKRENYTIGISLGCMRELTFQHITSKELFKFPQYNGDVFRFNSDVNKKFLHGVMPYNCYNINNNTITERISIVVWGVKDDNILYKEQQLTLANNNNEVECKKKVRRWKNKASIIE